MNKLVYLFLVILLFGKFSFEDASPSLLNIDIKGIDYVSNKLDGSDNFIIRGKQPESVEQCEELRDLGIKHLVIFKNRTRQNKIDWERGIFEDKEFEYKGTVTHIGFPWRDFEDFQAPCENVIDGLKALVTAYDNKELLYFHCTAGQDRTGLLAGLFRYILDSSQDVEKLFQEELCAHGYGAASGKPWRVTSDIRAWLTPLFLKMVYKIDKGYISKTNLNIETCEYDPEEHEDDDEYRNNHKYYSTRKEYKCSKP